MAEQVLVLEPGDERAQKIARAMGSPTATEILQILSEGPKSMTDLSERLSLPLNTAKYHVENLLEAGIISVADTRYSVKGREVKYYSLTDQLLIVAPKRVDVRSLLLKYAALFGIVALSSLVIADLLPLVSTWSAGEALPAAAPAAMKVADSNAGREAGTLAVQASFGGAAPSATVDPALAFFLGGVLVILVLLCYEAWVWKRGK